MRKAECLSIYYMDTDFLYHLVRTERKCQTYTGQHITLIVKFVYNCSCVHSHTQIKAVARGYHVINVVF